MSHCPGCGIPMSPPVKGSHIFGCGVQGERIEDHDDRGEFMIHAYAKEYSENMEHKKFATMENVNLLKRAVASVRDKLKSEEVNEREAALLVYNAIGHELNTDWVPVSLP